MVLTPPGCGPTVVAMNGTEHPIVSPARLRRARAAAGLTQDEAASAAGLARATVQNIERGRRSPQATVLAALARVYGVSMESLFVHEPEAGTPSTVCGTRNPHNSANVDVAVTRAVVGASPKG